MFKDICRSIAICLLVYAAPLGVRADNVPACQAETVDTLLNSTCTIGDKTFQFTQYQFNGTLAANDVTFIPDASNPDSPGFKLVPTFGRGTGTPVFNLTGGATEAIQEESLSYSVSITNPGSGMVIIGAKSVASGPAANPMTGDANNNSVSALAINTLNGGGCDAVAKSGLTEVNGIDFFSVGTATNDVLSSQGCKNFTQEAGVAEVDLTAQNAFASLGSGGFYVDEGAGSGGDGGTSPVPEPASFLLLGSGLLALCGSTRCRESLQSSPGGRVVKK